MASSIETKGLSLEIRKLRKKLRQIDNLNRLDRPLLEEEEDKILKTPSIRSQLKKKLKQLAVLEKQFVDTQSHNEAVSEVPPEQNPYGEDSQENSNTIYDVSYKDSLEMKRPYEEEGEVREEEDFAGGDSIFESRDGQEDEITPPKIPRRESEEEALPKQQGKEKDKGTSQEIPVQESIKRTTPTKAPEIPPSRKERGDEAAAPKVSRKEKDSGEGTRQGATTKSSQEKSQVKTKSKAKRPADDGDSWAKAKFTVLDLEGHNDIVCAVSCSGTRLLTGSRDTMVKYWDLNTGTELRSLGGHSGTVTSVILLSSDESAELVSDYDLSVENDRIAITGSKDCTIKIWSLETGQAVHSIYTYNPVECLGYIAERGLVVSGSDGGKVELWDIKEGTNVFSTIGHDDAITCVQTSKTNVYTSSSDGIIKLWQLRDKSLHATFVSENISSKSSTHLLMRRHIRSLAVSGETIYYGDDGLNVKALDWKRGLVHKLKNHTGDFGSTDAMCSTKDLIVCAGYDLDDGSGYLNFWSVPDEAYLSTLGDQETSRIIAIDCTQTREGALRIVTGGQELRVWDRVPRKQYSPQDSVPTEYNRAFAIKANDSDFDSDMADMSESDEADGHPRQRRRVSQSSDTSAKSSWSSWCSIV
ncbi:mitochondrial division protein 1-like [Asterias rubens]|uniref:mitochondrial division protein 1-like n=1 Tax=Asterias rubens TaxID=7604 RepID=UPI0014556F8B|nr:mitochondrial division protein 1-like [Asterias rubens]